MKLYYAETMNSYKTCALARHLDLDVAFHRLDLKTGEQRTRAFLAINPNGKTPALVDGDRRLWESNAILCHLAVAAGSGLWPRDDRQIEVIKWFSWGSEHFCHYADQLYFENIIRAEFGLGAPDPQVIDEATRSFGRYAAILDDHLTGRRFLLDDDLSVADFALAAPLPYARRAGIPLADHPAIARWHDRMMDLPGWQHPFVHPKG